MTHRTTLAAAALLVALSSSSSCIHHVWAYVNYNLPAENHRAMLQKMTSSVHDTPIGTLSPETLQTMPELMAAWSQSPDLSTGVFAMPPIPHQQGGAGGRRRNRNDGRSSNIECVVAAENLLKRIIDERHAGNDHAIPTTDAYNAILEGWAQISCGTGNAAAERAEEILTSMQQMYSTSPKNIEIQPNTESFRSVILAWSSASRSTNNVVSAVESAQRALDILTWMVKLYKSGENPMVKPDANCFEMVMNAWTQSGHPEAAERVEKLLMIMGRLYQEEESDDDSLRPNTRCFDQVLTAWGKRAESNPEAAQRAQDVLDHMEMLADQGIEGVKPTLASYSTVSSAWAKQIGIQGAQKAEKALRRVEDRFLAGESEYRPDTISYNIVTDAYVKARAKDSYKRAREVLTRQMKMHTKHAVQRCRPDVYSYTLVLNGCASTYGSRKERLKAFNVAESTFAEMCSSGIAPNHVTYGTMFKAAAKLLPRDSERRETVVRDVFAKCCQDGCVSDVVMNGLRMAASPKLYKELKSAEVPHDWSSNVPKKANGKKNRSRPRRRAEV